MTKTAAGVFVATRSKPLAVALLFAAALLSSDGSGGSSKFFCVASSATDGVASLSGIPSARSAAFVPAPVGNYNDNDADECAEDVVAGSAHDDAAACVRGGASASSSSSSKSEPDTKQSKSKKSAATASAASAAAMVVESNGLHPLLAHLPEGARFFGAGLVGNAAFYALDKALYKVLLGAFGAGGGEKKSPGAPTSSRTSAAANAAAAQQQRPKNGFEKAARGRTAPGSRRYGPPPGTSPGKTASGPTSPVRPVTAAATTRAGAAAGAPSAAALASVSFAAAYLLQIVLQHVLNAFLVYGPATIATQSLYLHSLARTYATYGGGLIVSTILNGWLIRRWGVGRDAAFFSTLGVVGILNFTVLGRLNRATAETEREGAEGGKKEE